MHSMHSWAQMVEQTLVIILFIERSDMHVYAFPKKERKEPCDLRFHLPMQRQAFFLEPWLVAKIIHAYIILSIEGFQCDLFRGVLASLVAAVIQKYQTMCHEALRACRLVPIKHSARWFCRLVPLVWLISKITWKHALLGTQLHTPAVFFPQKHLLPSRPQSFLAGWMNSYSYLDIGGTTLYPLSCKENHSQQIKIVIDAIY